MEALYQHGYISGAIMFATIEGACDHNRGTLISRYGSNASAVGAYDFPWDDGAHTVTNKARVANIVTPALDGPPDPVPH